MTTTTFSNLGYHLLWWRQPHIIFAEVLSSSWLFLVFSLHPSWPSSFSFHLPRYQQPPHEPDTTVCAHNISLCSHQSFQIPTFHFFFFLFILSPHSTYVSFLFLVSFFDIVTHLHLCMEYFPWIHGPTLPGMTSDTQERQWASLISVRYAKYMRNTIRLGTWKKQTTKLKFIFPFWSFFHFLLCWSIWWLFASKGLQQHTSKGLLTPWSSMTCKRKANRVRREGKT